MAKALIRTLAGTGGRCRAGPLSIAGAELLLIREWIRSVLRYGDRRAAKVRGPSSSDLHGAMADPPVLR